MACCSCYTRKTMVRIMILKRFKWKVLAIALVLLAALYVGRLSLCSLRQRDDVRKNLNEENQSSLIYAKFGLMFREFNASLVSVLNQFRGNSVLKHPAASLKPTVKTKPKVKPSIDIVNDYYPFVDFKFVFPEISPQIDKTKKLFMLVLVNSGAKADYRKRREAIRNTYGNQNNCEQRKALGDEKLKNLKWILVFVVGKAGPGTNDDELNIAEAKQHNDMLIGNITDNYINNIIKLYMAHIWASGCSIEYTFKTDDDVHIRVPRIVEYLVNAKFPKPFYGGMTYLPIRVNRVIGGKWTVSWKYFGEVNFPKFNAGAFIILSTDLLYGLFNYAYKRKPFHTDDAYIAIFIRDLGVKITTIFSLVLRGDMNTFVRKLDDCKLLGMHGFAHNMDPASQVFLHTRLEKLLCGNGTTPKC